MKVKTRSIGRCNAEKTKMVTDTPALITKLALKKAQKKVKLKTIKGDANNDRREGSDKKRNGVAKHRYSRVEVGGEYACDAMYAVIGYAIRRLNQLDRCSGSEGSIQIGKILINFLVDCEDPSRYSFSFNWGAFTVNVNVCDEYVRTFIVPMEVMKWNF